MEVTKLVLEYVKVILSAHMIVGMIIIVFIVSFHKELAGMINRIFSIKLPGGGELSMSQSEKASAELPSKTEPPQVPEPAPSDLPQNVSLPPDQVQAVRELLQAEKANAYLWEYRYLNYFLAIGTQRVLDWLASLQTRSNVRLYDNFWTPFINSAVERQAILNALQQHHLITITDDLIEVTDKGREYIQWRGPLPPPAPAETR